MALDYDNHHNIVKGENEIGFCKEVSLWFCGEWFEDAKHKDNMGTSGVNPYNKKLKIKCAEKKNRETKLILGEDIYLE